MLLGSVTHAEGLFEAYYRIEKSNRHIGYLVQRIEKDKKGVTTVSTYIRTRDNAGQEEYQSFRSAARGFGFAPVHALHNSNNMGENLRTEARFKANGQGAVQFQLASAKAPRTEKVRLQKNSLISAFTFLATNIPSLKQNVVYDYKAYSERRGWESPGELVLVGQQPVAGTKIYHVVDDYLGEPIESFVTAEGFPLGSRSPVSDWVTFWVPDRRQATGELQFPSGDLTKFFGPIPSESKAPWASAIKTSVYDIVQKFPKHKGSRYLSSTSKEKIEHRPLPRRGR
ncbi:MAG: hypothetical protein AB7F86_15175 [Bdellovibrionales bacterium]